MDVKIDSLRALIRMGQYFTIYMMLLVPYAVDLFAGKNSRWIVYAVPMMILVLVMMKNEMQYEFLF